MFLMFIMFIMFTKNICNHLTLSNFPLLSTARTHLVPHSTPRNAVIQAFHVPEFAVADADGADVAEGVAVVAADAVVVGADGEGVFDEYFVSLCLDRRPLGSVRCWSECVLHQVQIRHQYYIRWRMRQHRSVVVLEKDLRKGHQLQRGGMEPMAVRD